MATMIKRPCTSGGTGTVKPEVWYDYDIQCWVQWNVVQPCGHPAHLMPNCCAAEKYACMFIWEARRLHGLCGCEACVSQQWRQR